MEWSIVSLAAVAVPGAMVVSMVVAAVRSVRKGRYCLLADRWEGRRTFLRQLYAIGVRMEVMSHEFRNAAPTAGPEQHREETRDQ